MAYGILDSPLPGLTVSPTGERCCGFRGYQPGAHALLGMLGDDPVIVDSSSDPSLVFDQPAPDSYITPPIFSADSPLPLAPNILSPSLESMYPATVGTEFTSNGDGTYTNIQTGQSVSYDSAAAITQATGGANPFEAAPVYVGQGSDVTIVDPTTGSHSSVNTNNLTAAAQALQAAGQLVDAAGKLTTQGAALLHSGNLYKSPATASPFSGAGISNAMSSLTSWFTQSSIIAGFPNYGVVGVGVLAVALLPSLLSGKKRRRR